MGATPSKRQEHRLPPQVRGGSATRANVPKPHFQQQQQQRRPNPPLHQPPPVNVPALNSHEENLGNALMGSGIKASEAKALKSIVCELHPRLWLGSREVATQLGLLRSLGITACINCTEEAHLHPSHLAYFHVPVPDAPSANILGSFDAGVLPWVQRRLADPGSGSVLVYCQKGVSRSCTISLCLLLHLYPTASLLNLWHHVKRRRPKVQPNPGFLEALMNYERQVRGVNSVRVSKKRHGFIAKADALAPTGTLASSRFV